MSTKKKTTYRGWMTIAQVARAERQKAYFAKKRLPRVRRRTPHAELITAMKCRFSTKAERKRWRA